MVGGISEMCYWTSEHTTATHSGGSLRIQRSIAYEKAAKAAPPPTAALTPPDRASVAPARNPPATGFQMSFLARNLSGVMIDKLGQLKGQETWQSLMQLTLSMQHSYPEKRAPTLANPFPELHMFLPISLKTYIVLSLIHI